MDLDVKRKGIIRLLYKDNGRKPRVVSSHPYFKKEEESVRIKSKVYNKPSVMGGNREWFPPILILGMESRVWG